jgi:pescadillo protein
MGNRKDGMKKKKSIKANVTSKFSAKRKLSRMGKRVKKGEMGPSTEYITRSSTLRRLQVSLKDFRRLCILKGIYPRVPSKAPKGADKVYYELKDISYLAHEPLLHKFREFKTFMKKIRKAAGRKEFESARRQNDLKPKFVLNHLIKERYPRFIDALRDLDDALCMVHLFASLPSQGRITSAHTGTCREIVQHWQYYVAKSQTLQKVFVSIKGVYFQAEILGEPVTWLTPHQFTQAIPKEVDLRVMTCFLEFYEVFLKFVLYKLFNNMDLQYPPVVDKDLSNAGCFLLAVQAVGVSDGAPGEGDSQKFVKLQELEGGEGAAQVKVRANAASKKQSGPESSSRMSSLEGRLQAMEQEGEESDDEMEVEESIAAPLADAFSSFSGPGGQDEEEKAVFSRGTTYDASGAQINRNSGDLRSTLFQGLKFFVNREVPLDWLQLVIISAGGSVGWEGEVSPYAADDMTITHHIIDRPLDAEQSKVQQKKQREFVQPQWVFDSLNVGSLLPISRYAAGAKLPPHLSPFVDDDKEGYTPKYRAELQAIENGPAVAAIEQQAIAAVEAEEDYESGLRAERSGRKSGDNISKKVEAESEEEDDSNSDDDEEDEKAALQKSVSVPLASAKGPKGVVFERKGKAKTEVIPHFILEYLCSCVPVFVSILVYE